MPVESESVNRPYKYEVPVIITKEFDEAISEETTQIVPAIKITGDLKLDYEDRAETIIVWTNKKQKEMTEAK